MTKKFIRQESNSHSKLGKGRKKLQKWRKPKGRDSKMRLNIKNHSKTVSVGYKSPRKNSGKIHDLLPVLIKNINDLEKVGKDSIIIIARVGAKKKIEIIKRAQEKKLKILNLGGKNEA